jgi:hypothetical protein
MILPAVTGGGGGWNHQFDPDFRGQADPDSNNGGETPSAGELNAVNRSLHYWFYSVAYYITLHM